MAGLKQHFPEFGQAGGQVSQNEIDQYEQYVVMYPSVSNTLVGAVAGTKTTTHALTLTNTKLDYPRNLLYSIVGTNDIGGTITAVGKDQFGRAVTESAGFGTAAMGTPAGSVFGTAIFAQVSSASVTFAAGSAGNGTAQLGVGTVGTSVWYGLPTKIAGSTDVKSITWLANGAFTTLNGGTIGAYVNTTTHAFQGSAGVSATDIYVVTLKSSYDASSEGTMSAL